jgi:hypothetical protein
VKNGKDAAPLGDHRAKAKPKSLHIHKTMPETAPKALQFAIVGLGKGTFNAQRQGGRP